MKDNNCIFCKIANGEIPSRTLYEDDRYRVILDLGPATKGHALVLPKEHFADVYEIPADWAAGAMKIGQQMASCIVMEQISYRIMEKRQARQCLIFICT